MSDLITPWVKCDCCDDYVCSIHVGQHVYDCSCPDIDTWAESGFYPYDLCDAKNVRKFVAENPYPEE